jgi:hypothetical protein
VLAGGLGLLLEGVQHVHGLSQSGDVDHPIRAAAVPDPEFFDALATEGIGLKSLGCLPRCTWSSW